MKCKSRQGRLMPRNRRRTVQSCLWHLRAIYVSYPPVNWRAIASDPSGAKRRYRKKGPIAAGVGPSSEQ